MIISCLNFYIEYVHNMHAASLFLDASFEIFILSSHNSFWSAKHNSTALHCKMRHEYSVLTFAGPYNGALQRFYHLSESHNIQYIIAHSINTKYSQLLRTHILWKCASNTDNSH
jgi:hypothetical protein